MKCPRCQNELVSSQFFCSHCGYKSREEDFVKPFRTNAPINIDARENLTKKRIKLGYIISGLTLPGLLGFISMFTGSLLFFFVYFTPWIIFLMAFPFAMILALFVNIYGLKLIFYSIKPRLKGWFLIIYGYLLFALIFLVQPPINYNTIRIIPIPLFFSIVDIPIFIMIILGFYNISNFEKKVIPDNICFVPVILSNILPFFVFSMVII